METGGSITQAQDYRALEESAFARRLAARIEESALKGEFGTLAVVAPPAFLGRLRKAWGPHTEPLVADEVAGEFTGVSEAAMADRLHRHLRWLDPEPPPRILVGTPRP